MRTFAAVLALAAYVCDGRRDLMPSEHSKSNLAGDDRPSSQSFVELQQTPAVPIPFKQLAMLLLAANPAAGWHMNGFRGKAPSTFRGKLGEPFNAFPEDNTIKSEQFGRRGVLGLGLGGLAAAAAAAGGRPIPAALAEEPTVKLYFGAGCFWHVQHEFVGEEIAALGRKASQLTAVSGYAGGLMNANGKVCYHNARNIADYGSLGHAEAVQVEIPLSSVPRFAEKYFSLFGKLGIRHDPGDQGGEYRSVIGLPGGVNSVLFPAIQKAADQSPGGLKLVSGRGNEGDTFFSTKAIVYDSNKFPFYPGEVYHQFHNDFMGPPYGKGYNDLQKVALDTGAIKTTGCPEYR